MGDRKGPAMQTIPDEHLMARLVDGDEAALGELMRRWEAPVWCFIARMCAPGGSTDDVYQEVWTRVYLYRKRYRPDRPFKPFLFAVAVNCCRTALRRGRRPVPMRLDAPGAPADQIPSREPPPFEALLKAERSAQLHLAIHALPDAQRAVVLLHLLFEPSYEAIARLLGKSPGTVRSHMCLALRNLRQTLRRAAAPEESQVDHEPHSRQPN